MQRSVLARFKIPHTRDFYVGILNFQETTLLYEVVAYSSNDEDLQIYLGRPTAFVFTF